MPARPRSEKQPHPRQRSVEEIGSHHRTDRPSLLMGSLNFGAKKDFPEMAQTITELDVFYLGPGIQRLVKTSRKSKTRSSYRSTSRPEGRDAPCCLVVSVVMQKVPIARYKRRMRRRVVI